MMKILNICTLRVLCLFVCSVMQALPLMSQEGGESAIGKSVHSFTVKGRVTDAYSGAGIAGVRLTTPGLQVAAMTGESGEYSIVLPSLDLPLIVETPDKRELVVPVKGRTEVNISLSELEGIELRYNGWSGSEGNLSVQLQSGNVSFLDDALASHLGGQLHTVKTAGTAGAGNVFRLRGLNSLNLPSQPLFVVDGVVWQMQDDAVTILGNNLSTPLSYIDVNDVESIELLKNGSAIWGAKAVNGVILIKTKRGRDMVTRIDASMSVGFQEPVSSMPMMDATAYKRYATDIMRGMESDAVKKLQFINDDPTKLSYWDTHNDTDWLGKITGISMLQNYGISVSGGDDIALYRFSLGYTGNDGNIDGTSFERINVRFNSDIHLTESFSINADISYSQTGYKAVYEGIDEVRSPYYIALVKSPLYGPYQHNGKGMLTNRLSDTDELNVGTPLSLVGNTVPQVDKYRFNMNLTPSFRFGERLVLAGTFGLSWDKRNEDSFIPDAGVADAPLYNSQGEVYATALNEVRNLMARHSTLSGEIHVDWDILKGYRHSLAATVGGRFYSNSYKYTAGQSYNTGSDYMKALSNTNSALRFLTGYDATQTEGAWYFDAGYSFMNKYFFNAGASVESSSRFGAEADGLDILGVKWAPFYTLSAAWMLSSERFMKNLDFVDQLKLRVAHSLTGNDCLPEFANVTYRSGALFAYDAAGLVLANIGNEKLKWETTSRWNVGADLRLFNNRWSLSVDFYLSRTKDMLTRKQIPDVAGLEYFWDNGGELENRGFEIVTDVRAVDTKDFVLELGATVGHYKNEILSLPNGDYTTEACGGELLTSVGNPAALFYGYRTLGVFTTAEDAATANLAIENSNGALVPFAAGDIHFYDKDNNRIIDAGDRVVIGNPNPDIYGNFRLEARYKRFSLSALFTYSLGNDAYNALRARLESGSTMLNQTTAMENRWIADGQLTSVPRATYGDPMGNSRFSDRWIEDASYMRFKNLSLSYDVPLKQSFIKGLTVWASVSNIFTLTDYLGSDVEFSLGNSVLQQGIDAGFAPQSRTWQFGVKANL